MLSELEFIGLRALLDERIRVHRETYQMAKEALEPLEEDDPIARIRQREIAHSGGEISCAVWVLELLAKAGK